MSKAVLQTQAELALGERVLKAPGTDMQYLRTVLGPAGCKPAPPGLQMLLQHLFHMGPDPIGLILGFQLPIYQSLWTKMCKTQHQHQNHEPLQSGLLNRSPTSGLPSLAGAQGAEGSSTASTGGPPGSTGLLKVAWSMRLFFMSEMISKYYVSSFFETKSDYILHGAKFLFSGETGNSYCIISFSSLQIYKCREVSTGPGVAQVV